MYMNLDDMVVYILKKNFIRNNLRFRIFQGYVCNYIVLLIFEIIRSQINKYQRKRFLIDISMCICDKSLRVIEIFKYNVFYVKKCGNLDFDYRFCFFII